MSSTNTRYSFLDVESSSVAFDKLHAEKLLEFLYDSYQKELYCDISIKVENRVFRTHRFVLAMLSEYFRAFVHPGQEELSLPDICNGDIFETVLLFGYTSRVTLDGIDVQALAVCADFLGITSLKEICEIRMIKEICLENCLVLLPFADTYIMPDLLQKCVLFWCENYKVLTEKKEFFQIPCRIFMHLLEDDTIKLYKTISGEKIIVKTEDREKLLFKSVLKYMSANFNVELSGELLELFRAVKLPTLKSQYIAKHLNKHKKIKIDSQMKTLLKLAETYRNQHVGENSTAYNYPKYWLTSRVPCIYHFVFSSAYGTGGNINTHHAQSFDTEIDPYAVIMQITIWIRRWDGRQIIGRLMVLYSNGEVIDSGGSEDEQMIAEHVIKLNDGELIKNAELQSGWLIDSMKFTTSQNRIFGPYGGDGGGERIVNAPNKTAFMHGFTGQVVKTQEQLAVLGLSFRWVHFE